ncbi:hypothetical protein H6F88_02105 [Oculatella sp. FACHB-28]|uniref:hypothetical protein n=1 Tax=Oculatella sp. FACHB-28 TaxID=2692845 RepID=UPI0019ADB0C3|nr:hypothetical protein [Oculatella sp. FACHB-28]MBD1871569.1 hypothetical protein [Cyanobacteria bacterium FACHB-471]MBD2054828.1 hypothetical protein [Oculatella sp. FACHB-28]
MAKEKWTEEEFFEQLRSDPRNRKYADVVEKILRFAEDRGIREWQPRGVTFAVFTTKLRHKGVLHPFFSIAAMTRFPKNHSSRAGEVWGANGVEMQFQHMKPPFTLGSERQQQLREQLEAKLGVCIPTHNQQGGQRPNIPLVKFQNAQALQDFFDLIDYMISEVKST